MIRKISEAIINCLILNNIIVEDNREIFQFGLEQLLILGLNIIMIIFIGILTGSVWKVVLFTTAFMMLRSYAGGYHASSQLKCFLLTILITSVMFSVINIIAKNVFVLLGLFIVFSCIILILSPVESRNKPLDTIEYVVYKKRVILIWMIESIIILISMLAHKNEVSACVIIAQVVVGIVLIIEKVLRHVK